MQGDKAIIMDMDGVLLQTHDLHAQAWKKTFDEFLQGLYGQGKFKEFDLVSDYRKYLDGKTREEGIKSYLAHLEMDLPPGNAQDDETMNTIAGLGMRKQKHYQDLLSQKGPRVYADSVEAIKKWTNQHVPLAVVSSSKTCKAVLKMGNLEVFFDTIVDPELAQKKQLRSKPEPDYFVHGAELLGFRPDHCLVVEDSESGIRAAKKGGFLKVYGMVHEDDKERERELLDAGADKVIHSLKDIPEAEL